MLNRVLAADFGLESSPRIQLRTGNKGVYSRI